MSRSSDAAIAEVNDWMERFTSSLNAHESLKWSLGDLCLESRSMPDEAWTQVLPASEKVMHTLRQYEICAEKWDEGERCDQLSWFHHWILRDREDRKEWIDRCIEENIEEYEIRKIIRKEKKKERRMKAEMPLTITNSEYDTLLEKIGSLDAKLQRIKLDKRDFGKDARERAAELTLNKALKLEIASCIEKSCNKIENTLDRNSWSKDAARSTAADVKKLVKRLGKDDGKTVELLEGIQAKLLGISKQMNVTENKDIKRWDALMSHLNRDRWWQVWKWSVWNFRVSFTRRED